MGYIKESIKKARANCRKNPPKKKPKKGRKKQDRPSHTAAEKKNISTGMKKFNTCVKKKLGSKKSVKGVRPAKKLKVKFTKTKPEKAKKKVVKEINKVGRKKRNQAKRLANPGRKERNQAKRKKKAEWIKKNPGKAIKKKVEKKVEKKVKKKVEKKPTTYYFRERRDTLTQTGNNRDTSSSTRNRDRVEEQMNMRLHSWGNYRAGERWRLLTFEADEKKVKDWEKSFSLRDFLDLKNQTELYSMTGKKKNYRWKQRLTDEEFKRIYSY
tara:strand:+ start:39 stop:842 length:804 start_codon:yes stop_codon:yes gene_type:complete